MTMTNKEAGKRLPDTVLDSAYYSADPDGPGGQPYIVLEWLENECNAGRFGTVDEFLDKAAVERLSPASLITILTMAYHARRNLSNRESFLARVEVSLNQRIGSERTNNLLKNRR